MTDIAAEIRDILVFHLGVEEGLLTDDARLADDLGADRLDLVEIAMSCEERFDVDIPNHVAAGLATVGDAVRFVQAQLARSTGATSAVPLVRDSWWERRCRPVPDLPGGAAPIGTSSKRGRHRCPPRRVRAAGAWRCAPS